MSRIVDVEPLDCLAWKDGEHGTTFDDGVLWVLEKIGELPAVQPQQIVRCKDCKHWKDSDGVYRRGVDAESKCPLNTIDVYAGTFYCGYAERRTEND